MFMVSRKYQPIYMLNEGLAASTISTSVAAIGYVHRMVDVNDPTITF